MKVTVDDEIYEFNFERITNVEGMAIERATGYTYMDWAKQLEAGSMLALTALVWIIRKRQEPTLRFDDVEFSRVEIDNGDEEADPTGADEAASATTG